MDFPSIRSIRYRKTGAEHRRSFDFIQHSMGKGAVGDMRPAIRRGQKVVPAQYRGALLSWDKLGGRGHTHPVDVIHFAQELKLPQLIDGNGYPGCRIRNGFERLHKKPSLSVQQAARAKNENRRGTEVSPQVSYQPGRQSTCRFLLSGGALKAFPPHQSLPVHPVARKSVLHKTSACAPAPLSLLSRL